MFVRWRNQCFYRVFYPAVVDDDGLDCSLLTTGVSTGNDTVLTVIVKNNGRTTVNNVRVMKCMPLSNPTWNAIADAYQISIGDCMGLSLRAHISPFAVGTLSNTATVAHFTRSNTGATDALLVGPGVATTENLTTVVPGLLVSS